MKNQEENNRMIAKLLTEVKEAVIANPSYERGSDSIMKTKSACLSSSIFWPLIALLADAGLDACRIAGNNLSFCCCPEAEISKENAIKILDSQIASLTA